MPTVTITIYSCTLCGAEYREGNSHFTLIDGDGITRAYDVCSDCIAPGSAFQAVYAAGELLPGQRGKLARAAQQPLPTSSAAPAPPKKAKKQVATSLSAATERDPLTCPECKADGTTFRASKPQGLGAHRRHVHGVIGAKKKSAA